MASLILFVFCFVLFCFRLLVPEQDISRFFFVLKMYVCMYVYEYTVAVLMVVSHRVVVGNLNSGPLHALVNPACSGF